MGIRGFQQEYSGGFSSTIGLGVLGATISLIICFVDRAAAVVAGAVDVVAQQVGLFAFVAPGFYVFVPGKIDR